VTSSSEIVDETFLDKNKVNVSLNIETLVEFGMHL
jgi:hypothetical protein